MKPSKPAITLSVICLSLAPLISGCASGSSRRSAQHSDDEPPNRSGSIASLRPSLADSVRTLPADSWTGSSLSFAEALLLARQKNPELQAAREKMAAMGGQVRQARLLPNPALEIEVEEFAHSEGSGAFSQAKETLSIGQLILLGGKRKKEVTYASEQEKLAQWDFQTKQLEVLHDTAVRFMELLAANNELAVAREAHDVATQVHETITALVEAGETSPIEESRTRVLLANSRIELEQVEHEQRQARVRLAAMWGADHFDFEIIEGSLAEISEVPSLKEFLETIEQNPNLARWVDEIGARRAWLEWEEAKAWPDLTVKGGVQKFEATDSTAFLASVSIPLPFWNRNQGNIETAQARINEAQAKMVSQRVNIKSRLKAAYEALQQRHGEVRTLSQEALPNAQTAFELTREAYQEGKFGLIDVLDTRRALFDVQRQLNRARMGYHRARIAVETLIGGPIQTTAPANESDPAE